MPSKKGVQRKKTSKIYDIFVGCQISVVVKVQNSLTITGILLDECTDYVYLGSTEEVNAAIPKDNIGVVLVESAEIEIPQGTIRQ
mgnify:CR=1 FL=1